MGRWDDEEDWTGEPPEGRHSRERADPGYWRRVRLVDMAGAVVLVGLIVLAVVLLT